MFVKMEATNLFMFLKKEKGDPTKGMGGCPKNSSIPRKR